MRENNLLCHFEGGIATEKSLLTDQRRFLPLVEMRISRLILAKLPKKTFNFELLFLIIQNRPICSDQRVKKDPLKAGLFSFHDSVAIGLNVLIPNRVFVLLLRGSH